MSGELPSWLTDVTADRQQVRVFQIDKANLAPTGSQP